MRRPLKLYMAPAVAAAAIAFSAMPAYAASSSSAAEKIKTVYLDASFTQPEAGDEIDEDITDAFTAAEKMYTVKSAEFINTDNDEWVNGDIPEIEVEVAIDDTDLYKFASGLKVKVSSDVKVKSTKLKHRESDEATFVIKLKAVKGDLDEPEYLDWTGTYTAEWEEVSGAKSYDVKLLRNDSTVKTVTTSNNYYNFSQYMTKSGEYTFRVKAKGSNSGHSDWSDDSEGNSISSSQATNGQYIAESYETYRNNQKNNQSYNYNNTYYGNNVQNGQQSSYAVNGPGQVAQNLYAQYGNNPVAAQNPTQNNQPAQNSAQNGWQNIGGQWKYWYNGAYVADTWLKDKDGKFYMMDAAGNMIVGKYTSKDSKNEYFLNDTVGDPDKPYGSMITGWKQFNDGWRFYNDGSATELPLGAMFNGYHIINGMGYTFVNGLLANQ